MSQAPRAVLMVNPLGFNPNPETALDNSFQDADELLDAEQRSAVATAARAEVDQIVSKLEEYGIDMIVVDDLPGTDVPDSVFPNNWVSTHLSESESVVVIYPMAMPSRRRERRMDILDIIRTKYTIDRVIDLSSHENDGVYLEGTGALVLDHINHVAYVSQSGRAHETAIRTWCSEMKYEPEIFNTVDFKGFPIYHTNVILSIATNYILVALDCIPDLDERSRLLSRLSQSGREVVLLDQRQVGEFSANALELQGKDGLILAISERAHRALRPDQLAVIERHATIVAVSIPTIERAGGSMRCTLAGIHLSPI